MGEIKVAIAGLGSCASALIQGVEYYKHFREGEIPGLMQEARSEALDAAAKDGVITNDRATWMESRGFGRGGMHGGFGQGYGNGSCPMYGNGSGAQGYGQGGRWGGVHSIR